MKLMDPAPEIAMMLSRDFDHKNVPKAYDSDIENKEFELNFCQLWGKNWRQFTSVLPGLLLLLTIGMHDVFTIYECDQFRVWPKLLHANDSFLRSPAAISPPHANFENYHHDRTLSRSRRSPSLEHPEYSNYYDYDYIGENKDANPTVKSFRDRNNENGLHESEESTSTSTTFSYTSSTTTSTTITAHTTNPNQTDYDDSWNQTSSDRNAIETSTGKRSKVSDYDDILYAENDYPDEHVRPALSTVAYPTGKMTDESTFMKFMKSYEIRLLENMGSTTQVHLDSTTYAPENSDPRIEHKFKGIDFKSMIFIMMWFCGAIIGNMFGALLIRDYKKRTIYVSGFRRIGYLLFFVHVPFLVHYSISLVYWRFIANFGRNPILPHARCKNERRATEYSCPLQETHVISTFAGHCGQVCIGYRVQNGSFDGYRTCI